MVFPHKTLKSMALGKQRAPALMLLDAADGACMVGAWRGLWQAGGSHHATSWNVLSFMPAEHSVQHNCKSEEQKTLQSAPATMLLHRHLAAQPTAAHSEGVWITQQKVSEDERADWKGIENINGSIISIIKEGKESSSFLMEGGRKYTQWWVEMTG